MLESIEMSRALQIPEAERLQGDLEFIQEEGRKGVRKEKRREIWTKEEWKGRGEKKQVSLLASPTTHSLLPQLPTKAICSQGPSHQTAVQVGSGRKDAPWVPFEGRRR